MPNIYYRTIWKDEKAILTGSSFASAKIVGILSKKINELVFPLEKIDLLRLIANRYLDVEKIHQ